MRVVSSSPMSPHVAEHVRRRAHLGWIAVAAFLGVISSGATSQAQTTVTLTSSLNPSNYLNSVTFTATVSPPTAVGTVSFFDQLASGDVPLCTNVPLGAGNQATCTRSNLFANTLADPEHPIIAVYNGDGTESNVVVQIVNRAPTGMTLTTDVNPSSFGQNVRITVTIVPSQAVGQVKFLNDGNLIGTRNLSGGQAVLNFSTLTTGTHSLTATYGGQTNFEPSTSNAVQQVVGPALSTTTLSVPSPSTVLCGHPVTLTATVDPIDAIGQVRFSSNGNRIFPDVDLVAGVATLEYVPIGSGSFTIDACYLGNSFYAGSCAAGSGTTRTLTVNKASTATSVTSDINPSFFLQQVTLTATVNASGAGGTVQFKDQVGAGSPVNIGTARPVNNGVATLAVNLVANTHSITAEYSGDGCYLASTSPPYSQLSNRSPTTTTVTSDPNASYFSQNVRITATVVPITAVGQVRFFSDGNQIGTATVNTLTGLATLNFSTLVPGLRNLTATYLGGTNYATSTSASHNHTVFPGPTLTVLSSNSPSGSIVGDAVDLIASVLPGDATGSVRFYEGVAPDTTLLGVSEVDPSSGVAIFTVPNFTAGVHRLTAKYVGNFVYAFSMSAPFDQHVDLPSAMRRADAMLTQLALPREFALSGAWPNPSHGALTMAISLPKASQARVSVLDLQGREVAVLADGGFPAGRHEVRWDGRTGGGQAAAGLYFIRMITPEKKFVNRVAIAR